MPNLTHYSVIRDLLKGNFRYTSNGIIDKNHNIFFTFNDIKIMATECGYKPPYITYGYNIRNAEDDLFLNNLCTLAGEDMRWHFVYYKYITKFQN